MAQSPPQPPSGPPVPPRSKAQAKKAKAAERAERAAALRREQERRERRRRALMVGGVVLALVLIVGVLYWISGLNDSDPEVPAAGDSEYGVTVGEADAPHEVVIYEDFLCPFCGELEAATREDLTRLAADGEVYLEYRPFDLLGTDYSVAAANAFAVVLEEAGPEEAKEFHDLVFADQPEEAGPYPDADWLVDKAVEAGASEDDVRPAIEDQTSASWVEGATQEAEDSGVRRTPTIILDGEVFEDGRTVDQLAENLIGELQ